MALPRWITAPVGAATQAAGRTYDYATPGSGTSRVTNIGRAITDPNKVYSSIGGGLLPGSFQPVGQMNSMGSPTDANGDGIPDAGAGGGGDFSTYGTLGAAADPDAALRGTLKGRIAGRAPDIEAIYAALFGDLDTLLRSRDAELETQYGEQFKKAGDTYAAAIPQIENSYAAIGSADSTDQSDAKTKAKGGFDETTKTIGKNKETDKAKLGQYGNESRAKFSADRDSARRAVGSANETTDVGALRGLSNDLDSNLSQTGVTRATLGTDAGARGAISALTADSGRYEAAVNALDSIIKGSMSGAVKEAAVEAVTTAGGLSPEEKKKVQQTYGNVYAEQAAL